MKKYNLLKFIIIICFTAFIIIVVLFFPKCSKTKEMEAVITVKYRRDSTLLVGNAHVIIQKVIIDNKVTSVEGYTDATGQFRQTFKLEAILSVTARKGSLCDSNYIRLVPEKTVYKTLLIDTCKGS